MSGHEFGDDRLTVVPANEASWEDLQLVIGTAGAGVCQCQRFKLRPRESFRSFPAWERADRLRAQTNCGHPEALTTSGVVGYLDREPVGWCAVEPRSAYAALLRVYQVPWEGRTEDKTDDGVWAVTCLLVRKGFRGRGLTYPLARGAVEFARLRGARALEAYPMVIPPGTRNTWGELYVGARQVFQRAGLEEVSHPTPRRVVMRIEFEGERPPATRRRG